MILNNIFDSDVASVYYILYTGCHMYILYNVYIDNLDVYYNIYIHF